MLPWRNLIAVIGLIGFMTTTPHDEPVDTKPVAYLYEIEGGQRRPEAVVFRAPENKLVYVYLTGKNKLDADGAQFLVNLDETLRAKLTAPGVKGSQPDSLSVNFQSVDLIKNEHLGNLVNPVYPEWLATIVEAWGRPPRGTPNPQPAVA